MPINTESVQQLSSVMRESVFENKDIKVTDNGDVRLRTSRTDRLQGKFQSADSQRIRLANHITDIAQQQGAGTLQTFRTAVAEGVNASSHMGTDPAKSVKRASHLMASIDTAEHFLDYGVMRENFRDNVANAKIGTHQLPIDPVRLQVAEADINRTGAYNEGRVFDEFKVVARNGWSFTANSGEQQYSAVNNGDESYDVLLRLAVDVCGEELQEGLTLEEHAERERVVARALASILNFRMIDATMIHPVRMAFGDMRLLHGEPTTASGVPFNVELTLNGNEVEVTFTNSLKIKGITLDGRTNRVVMLDEEDKTGEVTETIKFSLDTNHLKNGNVKVVPQSLSMEQNISFTENISRTEDISLTESS